MTTTAPSASATGRTNPSAVLRGERDLVVEDRPVPEPGPGEVLVEVGAVGICGSDVHYYEHGRIGPFVVEAPMVIGHEAAGTVVGVGDGVDPGRIGQLVALGVREGKDLQELSLAQMRAVSNKIGEDVYGVLELKNVVNVRNSYGGTALAQVEVQIDAAKAQLEGERDYV